MTGGGQLLRRRMTAALSTGLLLGALGVATQPLPPAAHEALAAAPLTCATPGLDGPGGVLGGVVNTYYPGRVSVAAGDTVIPVGAPTGSATPIGAGDMLLVVQMQAASIDSTNTSSYGDGVTGDPASGWTSLSGAGTYEYVTATGAVAAGVVPIAGSGAGGGLLGSYTEAAATATHGQRTFQVVRVPQYSSATLSSALTASPWNGSDGGILALDVAGATDLGGATVSVDSLGFRGGAGITNTGSPTATGTDERNLSTYAAHGQKGEGVAGTPAQVWDTRTGSTVATGQANDGYPNGSSARGAPGTAGGGGTDPHPAANDQNTGGGGGGNGGAGGHGGNSWSSNLPEGGFGGTAYAASTTQATLGGGGGAGTRNNSVTIPGASSGGTGGGMVLIRTGLVSGTGMITADGGTGPAPLNDGGGGGGGGGTVVLAAATGGLGGPTVHADAGAGADAWPTQPPGANNIDEHGPGGGGGGGVVITSAAPAAQTVAAGPNGTATTAQLADNATPGGTGIMSRASIGAAPGVMAGASCIPVLTAAKTTSTPSVVQTPSGTGASFVISIVNASAAGTAVSTEVSDVLPAGFSFAATTALTLAGGTVRSAVVDPAPGDTTPVFGTFSIPASGSVAVAFTVHIASSVASGTYHNTGTATYADPQRTTAGGTLSVASAPVAVRVNAPDLVVSKSHAGSFVAGQDGAYTLIASNAGDGPTAGSVSVTDTLPTGLMPTGAGGSGWTCSISGQAVVCTRADALAAGRSYPAVTVTVSAGAAAVPAVTNTATVAGGGEFDTGNDSASDPTVVSPSADVSIVKTHNGTFTVGHDGAYTLALYNAGPSPTGLLTVTDDLPSSLTYVSAAGSAWTCSATGRHVSCTDAAGLVSGANSTILLTVSVGAGAAGGVDNTATVGSATADPNPANNSSTDSTTAPSADVSIVKTHGAAFTAGEQGIYTLAVANTGPSASGTLTVDDMLPAGLTWVSGTGTDWRCVARGQDVTCTDNAGLRSGGSSSISLVVDVGAGAAPAVTNTASIAADSYDPDTANNRSTDTAPVGVVDLTAVKRAVSSVSAGASATYAITVTNIGTASTFAPAVVTDVLPDALHYVSATGTGWSCAASGQTVTCANPGVIAPNASSVIEVVVDVASSATGAVTNTASVATPGDVNGINDVGSSTAPLTDPRPAVDPTPPTPSTGAQPTDQLGPALALTLLGSLLLRCGVRRREPGRGRGEG